MLLMKRKIKKIKGYRIITNALLSLCVKKTTRKMYPPTKTNSRGNLLKGKECSQLNAQ